MRIDRRGFFATLLAPLTARLLPKPKPVPWWLVTEQWGPRGQYWLKAKQPGDTQVNSLLILHKSRSPYWHGQPPLVRVDMELPFPWVDRPLKVVGPEGLKLEDFQ